VGKWLVDPPTLFEHRIEASVRAKIHLYSTLKNIPQNCAGCLSGKIMTGYAGKGKPRWRAMRFSLSSARRRMHSMILSETL
jgi:hypothetical protein